MEMAVCADGSGTQCILDASGSHASMVFTLKRVREDSCGARPVEPTVKATFRRRRGQIHSDSDEEAEISNVIRQKPWISSYDFDTSSDDDCDQGKISDAVMPAGLPVGVVRGCPSCEGCQKVYARWRPESECRPSLEEAPVFFPLEEEFQDTMKYIASISAEAEQYGICRIVPPHSWRPPCPLKDSEKRRTVRFPTRLQQVHKLQVRDAQVQRENRKKTQSQNDLLTARGTIPAEHDWKAAACDTYDDEGEFGFEPGPEFTLEAFEKYANQFEEEYFRNKEPNELCTDHKTKTVPSVENKEGEYWRIVEHSTEQIEVLYGADIETRVFGSGFPKMKTGIEPTLYERSGWNLNNIARLPGSVLTFEEAEISGVLVPWLYVGMCFSSFCWHVEDHHFYSLNYMHFGSPKVWYGVPGHAAHKLEDAMKKHLPDLFEEQPDLLHKLVTQLSPSLLKAAGVPVYRAVQRAGEFIITFPRAYHAGFNCGFNCAEAVNVAPVDWLPHGQKAVELYREQKRKSSVSHDKLLLGAAKHAFRLLCQAPGTKLSASLSAWRESFGHVEVLVKALKDRVGLERMRRTSIENLVHVKRMDIGFDAVDERECLVCHYDLHLSAIGCDCSHEKYTCLEHVQELCACAPTRKYALYRYDLPELDMLLAALEGIPHAANNLEQANVGSQSACVLQMEVLKQPSDVVQYLKPSMHTEPKSSQAAHHNVGSQSACVLQTEVFKQPSDGAQNLKPSMHTEPESSQAAHNKMVLQHASFTGVASEMKDKQAHVFTSMNGNMGEYFLSSLSLNNSENNLTAEKSIHSLRQLEGERLEDTFKENEFLRPSTPICSSASVQDRESSINGHVYETRREVEVIELSDDEAEVGARNVPTASPCTMNISNQSSEILDNSTQRKQDYKGLHSSNQRKVFPAVLPNQGTNYHVDCPIENTMQASAHGSLIATANISLKFQHECNGAAVWLPSFCPAKSTDNVASRGTARKDRMHVGHFQSQSSYQLWDCPTLDSYHQMAKIPSSNAISMKAAHLQSQRLVNKETEFLSAGKDVGNSGYRLGGYLSPGQPHERYDYKVELINVGQLVLHKSWYSKDAIFPAGFRSRVVFPSILDPFQSCFYISEILDCGHAGPLFKVVMENHPSEVFIHPSIDKCWQMVQERVNMTIRSQHHLGNVALSLLRPSEEIQGIELFGFTSPDIIKAVESLDWKYQCLEYWAGRMTAVELLKNQHQAQLIQAKTNYIDRANNFQESFLVIPYANQKIVETATLGFDSLDTR